MIEIKEGETALHTIKNPGQALFLALVIILIITGVALGLGFLSSKV